MNDNKIADKITKFLKTLRQNTSEIVENDKENMKLDRVISEERYISPEKTQKIIDDLRLI